MSKTTDDSLHLRPYGYAPGGYMSRCHKCGTTPTMDKRAITCKPCAEFLHAEATGLDKPSCPHFGECHPGFCPCSDTDGEVRGFATVAHCFIGSMSERKANARLIAAAPELLAALIEAKAALDWVIEQAGGPVCEHEAGVCFCKESAALNSARAALSRAI